LAAIAPLLLLACASSGCAGAPPKALPADVREFLEQREACLHWGTEDPYDEARRAEIAAGVERDCRGLDRKLRELRGRHRRDAATHRVLMGLEALGF
jgi:hypothetical protein